MAIPANGLQVEEAHQKYLVGMDYLRKFAASFAMFHLFEQGLYEELEKRPAFVEALAEKLSLKPDLLHEE